MFIADKFTTIEEYINVVYLPRKKNELKISTYTRYEGLCVRIIEQLGHIPISKLSQAQVYDFYDYLRNTPAGDPTFKPLPLCISLAKKLSGTLKETTLLSLKKGNTVNKKTAASAAEALNMPINVLFAEKTHLLSDRTIAHHHRLLYAIMKETVYDGLVDSNVMDKVRPPKVSADEARCLDREDIAFIIKALDLYAVSPYKEILKLIIYTGMRRGEACGLEYGDIDFNRSTISIKRSSYYLPKQGIYTDTPKTRRSCRVVSFGQKVMDIIVSLMKRQGITPETLKDNLNRRLFNYDDGHAINPNQLTRYYLKFVTVHDLPKSSVHTLRHTNASILLSVGTPITTVSGRLGHSTSEITLRYYAHQLTGDDEKAAKALEKEI